MKLGSVRTAMALVTLGLALVASQPPTGAGATNMSGRTGATAAPGKWRHPVNLPVKAEQPELSPAYESASSSRSRSRGSSIKGTAFLPVILADFSDNPAERTLHTPADYQNMLFQDGYPYGAGSLRDYYQD